MGQKSDKETEVSPKQTGSKGLRILLILVGIVILVVAGAFLLKQNNNKPEESTPSSGTPNSGVTLYLEPSTGSAIKDKTLTLAVWVNTNGHPVNAVQANLNYPTDKFKFESIDSVESAFKIEAESTGGNGKITIARGETGTVTGKQLVAKINLTPLVDSGKADVTFANNSAVVQSTDNTNILGSTTSGRYNFESK